MNNAMMTACTNCEAWEGTEAYYCSCCHGEGEVPAICDECAEPATERSPDGTPWCAVCAAAVALEAERTLERVRRTLVRSPRIARDIAKARGLFIVANDIDLVG